MSSRDQSSMLTGLDADTILSRVRSTAGEHLLAFVEYDTETYNVLYMAERATTDLGGPENTSDLADRLHRNYQLDFNEKQMHEELYDELGTVRAFGVFFDDEAVLRFVDDMTGLYVSLDMSAPFDKVIEAVYDVIEV